MLGRIGSVRRADNPLWFWFRVVTLCGFGNSFIVLCVARRLTSWSGRER
jgi:hypothetical protein